MKDLRKVRFAGRTFGAILYIGMLCLMVVGCLPAELDLPGSGPSVVPDTLVTPDTPAALEVSVPDGAVNYFEDGISFERAAGEVSVVFRTKEDWTVKVVDANEQPVTWCSLSSALGGAGLHNVKIGVEENMGKSSRIARIVLMAFEDASKVAVIEVSQEGTALFLERTAYAVSPADTTIAVQLQSNVDFEYRIEDGVDWLRESPSASRALTTHAMAFAVDANPSYRSRDARIYFYNAQYGMADTLTLVQQGLTPVLTVPEGYTDCFAQDLVFDYSSGEAEVVFHTNIHWAVQVVPADSSDVSWCTVDSRSGSAGLHKLMVRASRNDTYGPRSAVLRVLCDTIPLGEILVLQNQENAILLGRRECQVSSEATAVEVTLSTNVAFEYTILDADWLRERQSATRGLTAHRLVFEIDANPSHVQREAKIVFRNSDLAVSDTLTIGQDGFIPVTTGEATHVTASSAELGGEVYAANQYIACGILYGTSPELSSTNGSKKSTTSKGAFSVSVTGLQSGTTYYYCAFVVNDGEYEYGDVRSFTTEYLPVTVTTGYATEITMTAATLSGTVNNTHQPLSCGIIYGTTSSLSSTSGTLMSTTSKGSYEVSVSGLSENTTYYYRAYVIDGGGYKYGDVKSFTTKKAVSVTTGIALNITAAGATLYGTVNNSSQSLSCGIIYGITSSLSSTSGTKKSTTSNGGYSVSVTDLSENTTYYYRAYVIDGGEYKYGDVKLFTTKNSENNSDTGQFEAIDLGLSVKWASCNVGANSPEEYGGYYAWGETEEKRDYSWATYKWCNGSYETLTKYCTESFYGTVDNKTVLDPEDDVAHVKWGGNWRMPTWIEIKELCNKCTWTWTKVNGVDGQKITGPNGNSIFLPATGYREGTGISSRGSYGDYWPSTLREDRSFDAHYIYFGSNGWEWSSNYRYKGRSVRPVADY